MSLFQRAFLYITRKCTKSIILLMLLFVIATLVLSGVAIKDATQTAELNVRQALGGIFTLQQNTNDPDKWVSTDVGGYGSASYYGGAPLTVELADYIQNNVSGVIGYNATYTNYVVPMDESGNALDLIASEDDGSSMNSLMAGYGDFNSTVSTYASTNTAYDSYFSGGYLELAKGRHFTTEEGNVAIISKELAELNKLEVGDKITLRMSEYKASLMGYDAGETHVEVEIVGLFQSTTKSTTSLSNWSMDNSIFTTLDVLRVARPDMGNESYERISFYVKDPGELDDIVKAVQNLPDLDSSDFVVDVDRSNVDAVIEPLANMNHLISVLMLLVLIVGAVILYLILSNRIKERIHESGVLLSLGFSKRNITFQYLMEVIIIAALAFTLSVLAAGAVSQAVGNGLLDYTLTDNASDDDSVEHGTYIDGNTFVNSGDYAPDFDGQGSLTEIEVVILPADIVLLYGVGMFIICLSVVLAEVPILRMKPREILSKMS